MTDNDPSAATDESGTDSVRRAVGDELMRAARAYKSEPWFRRRRWLAIAAGMIVVAVPGGIAAAELASDEPFSEPAPAPLFSTDEFSSCPESVQRQIVELDSISEYPSTPGYPVEGCPTLEDLEERGFDPGEPALSAPAPDESGCGGTMQQLSASACRELAPSGS